VAQSERGALNSFADHTHSEGFIRLTSAMSRFARDGHAGNSTLDRRGQITNAQQFASDCRGERCLSRGSYQRCADCKQPMCSRFV
jgi:hypothetical protein